MTSQPDTLNILIVSNCPLQENQGSGYVICGFAKRMEERGHRVKAYGPDEIILNPTFNKARRLRLFIGYTLKAIREAWDPRESYDIIELWGGVGWLACLILTKFRLRNYKVISRSNGLEPHNRQIARRRNSISLGQVFSNFNTLTDCVGFRNADLLTVVSSYDERFALIKSYQKKARLLMLENPLPDEWLQQPVKLTGRPFTVGFVGTWIERKGSEKLADIINSLTHLGSKCNWIIAGVGEGGKIDIINNTKIESGQIYEGIAREKLRMLYHGMTIFLCLSSYESFGMVCSEAMACGCILVSTNVGFANGLIDEHEYILIDRDHPDAVARKIYQIETNLNDYEAIGVRGHNRVQQLKWSRAVDMLESKYLSFFRE